MMKTFLSVPAMLFLACTVNPVRAQNHRAPFQVSFVYPLGTHGFRSNTCTFDFSLNMLIGNTGGIDGFEVGGLMNKNNGDVSGFQAAGIANTTPGSVSGFQASGIFSKADSIDGVQINGIMGLVNTSSDVQISGIANISKQSAVSIAGIVNINNDEAKGIQISGLLNKTRKLNGIQLGLINIADSSEKGLSIGLINIMRDRFYDEWAFEIADYQNFAIGYRLGTREFYTLFSAGFNIMKENLWVAGVGFGHEERINPVFAIRPEIVWYSYYPMDFEKPLRDTWACHIRISLMRDLNKHFAISAAPGFYIAEKSNRQNNDVYGYEQSPIPAFFDAHPAGSDDQVSVGFGMSLAILFK